MRVIIDDQTYFVVFKHMIHEPPVELVAKHVFSHGRSKGKLKTLQITHTTICEIREAPTASGVKAIDAELISHGKSWCSVNDKFDLHFGRRNALRKALDDMPEEDDEINRFAFWEAFVKTLPKPKPTVKQLKRELRDLNKRIETLTKITANALP